ncbi:MAG: serine hydrolase domain-containing protein [Thermodesulfobacteriota bacterium]
MPQALLKSKLRALGQEAVDQGLASALAVGVTGRHWPAPEDFTLYLGHLDQKRQQQLGATSLFDLASLTKPLATSLAILALVSQGKVTLTSPLAQLLPQSQIPSDKAEINLAQLLRHASGLPPHRPFYLEVAKLAQERRQEAMVERVLAEPLLAQPGQQETYSDLGFVLLGEIVRQLSGQRLDLFCRETIYRPLGLAEEIIFLPRDKGHKEFVATEDCPWRGRLLAGEVHDQNCWAVGGVSGQAGLFARLAAVLKLCRFLLAAKQGQASHPNLDQQLLQRAMTPQNGPHSWGLGFDQAAATNSAAGNRISADNCGHLGFTGTSFWLDFQREVAVVLLCNRIHPSTENDLIRAWRPRLHDAIFSLL